MKHCAQFGCPECIHMENKLELLRLLKEYHEDPERPGWFWAPAFKMRFEKSHFPTEERIRKLVELVLRLPSDHYIGVNHLSNTLLGYGDGDLDYIVRTARMGKDIKFGEGEKV